MILPGVCLEDSAGFTIEKKFPIGVLLLFTACFISSASGPPSTYGWSNRLVPAGAVCAREDSVRMPCSGKEEKRGRGERMPVGKKSQFLLKDIQGPVEPRPLRRRGSGGFRPPPQNVRLR